MNHRIEQVGVEDVTGVRSRVSWGAVLSGGVVALSVYVLMSLFFAGVGLSLSEAGVKEGTAAWIAVGAGVLSLAVALFIGGCTTSMLTAGETRREAYVYGMLTWAVVMALTLGMVGMGMRGGYNALVGTAMAVDRTNTSWEQVARDSGVSQQQIDTWKQQADPATIRAQANDPANQEAVRRGAMIAAWATLIGTLLSLGASVMGSVVGSGPNFRLVPGTTAVVTEQRLVTS